MDMGDTQKFRQVVQTNGGWTIFISVISVVLVILGLSITAAYKASATEKQTEINTGDIEDIKKYGERITRIETTVGHIREEQKEMKVEQTLIRDNTMEILIQLRAIQLNTNTHEDEPQ